MIKINTRLLDLYKITANVTDRDAPDRATKSYSRLLVCEGMDTAVALSKEIDFNVRLDPNEVLRIDSIENITHSCIVHVDSVV